MSIASEIERIKTNIMRAYTKLNEKGATMPSTQNSNNLTNTIDSITAGSGDNIFDYFSESIQNESEDAMYLILSSIKKIPNIDISNVVSGQFLFTRFSGITEIPNMDFNNIINADYMFSECTNLQTLNNINISNALSAQACFNNDENLKSINNINISSIVSEKSYEEWDSPVLYMFVRCSQLETISFSESINVSIDFSHCTLLNHESLLGIISVLSTTSTTKVMNFGTANLTKLTDEEKAIATSKGWTLS